jgi:hypothetical protein
VRASKTGKRIKILMGFEEMESDVGNIKSDDLGGAFHVDDRNINKFRINKALEDDLSEEIGLVYENYSKQINSQNLNQKCIFAKPLVISKVSEYEMNVQVIQVDFVCVISKRGMYIWISQILIRRIMVVRRIVYGRNHKW